MCVFCCCVLLCPLQAYGCKVSSASALPKMTSPISPQLAEQIAASWDGRCIWRSDKNKGKGSATTGNSKGDAQVAEQITASSDGRHIWRSDKWNKAMGSATTGNSKGKGEATKGDFIMTGKGGDFIKGAKGDAKGKGDTTKGDFNKV